MPSCPRCGSPHDSLDGVAIHAWKKNDEEHSDIDSKDDGMRMAVAEDTDSPIEADAPEEAPPEEPAESDGGVEFPENPDADPDPEPDEELTVLSCGCEVDAGELSPGVYQCSGHGTKFKVKA